MVQELTTISPLFSTPYLTIAEYKQAPTAVDVDDLVGGGSFAVNDQELTNVISRASSWIDSHCNQVLGATVDTDSFRARVSRDGFLRIHPRYSPIVSVVSASYGSTPTLMNAIDVTTAWIEQASVVFPFANVGGAFTGSLQLGMPYSPTQEQFVTITYVNGYANTTLTANSLASATSLTVGDLTGFQPNQKFMVYDGTSTEMLQVSSSFVASTGAGSLTLASPAVYAHTSSMSVSALPPAVKQAAIYMTNVILKSRGNSALVMGGLTPTMIQPSNPAVSGDYNSAVELLKPYRRMR